MDTRKRVLVLAALAAVGMSFIPAAGPVPLPFPNVRPDGPDLVPVFQSAGAGQGRTDAAKFGFLCRAIESRLTKERTLPEDKRRLTTGVRIDDFRAQVRVDYLDGNSFNAKYPGLKPVLVDWFDSQVGKSGNRVDDAQLDKWIGAFKKLADNAEYASARL